MHQNYYVLIRSASLEARFNDQTSHVRLKVDGDAAVLWSKTAQYDERCT